MDLQTKSAHVSSCIICHLCGIMSLPRAFILGTSSMALTVWDSKWWKNYAKASWLIWHNPTLMCAERGRKQCLMDNLPSWRRWKASQSHYVLLRLVLTFPFGRRRKCMSEEAVHASEELPNHIFILVMRLFWSRPVFWCNFSGKQSKDQMWLAAVLVNKPANLQLTLCASVRITDFVLEPICNSFCYCFDFFWVPASTWRKKKSQAWIKYNKIMSRLWLHWLLPPQYTNNGRILQINLLLD